jgi:probable rRNA maturation factor
MSREHALVVRSHQRACRIDSSLLRQIARELIHKLFPNRNYQLGIYLVDAKEMTHLNETFLRHVGSTDVITFQYSAQSDPLEGELFVCVDEALVQARRFRTSWQSEVLRYVVHGLLHLCGYDDRQRKFRRKMKLEENRLVNACSRRFDITKLGRIV